MILTAELLTAAITGLMYGRGFMRAVPNSRNLAYFRFDPNESDTPVLVMLMLSVESDEPETDIPSATSVQLARSLFVLTAGG